MKIKETEFPGLFILEPVVYHDERGYFFESFRQDHFEEKIRKVNFLQENESYSKKGTLRGVHYQLPPFEQAKLVRVTVGSVLDVAVDLRRSSPTFGRYYSIELSDVNKYQMFIPRGFGHGFLTITDFAILSYKVDNYFDKKSEAGIIFNDIDLSIDWKISGEIIVSNKDLGLQSFMKFKNLR